MFRALRVRNFRIYASANLVSLTGTWMQRIGQDWLVLQLSGDSGIALGLITALQFGPTLLLSMYGGVLADRYAKRRVLVITQTLMGVLALLLGRPGRHRRRRPVARVRPGRRAGRGRGDRRPGPAGVRLGDGRARACWPTPSASTRTIFNGARLVGPALAGLLIGGGVGQHRARLLPQRGELRLHHRRAGRRCAPPSCARARRSPGPRASCAPACAYTWAHPDLVLAMVLAFLIGTFGFNYQVTIALMARERFDLGAEAFGLLSTLLRRSARSPARCSPPAAASGHGSGSSSARRSSFGLLTVVAGLMPSYASFAVLLVPDRRGRPGVQRGQQQLRAARRRATDARPGDGALLHVLHGRHARRRAGDRLDLRAPGCSVGPDPRRRGLRGRGPGRGSLAGPRPPGARRGGARPTPAEAAGGAADGPVGSAAGGGGGGRGPRAGQCRRSTAEPDGGTFPGILTVREASWSLRSCRSAAPSRWSPR